MNKEKSTQDLVDSFSNLTDSKMRNKLKTLIEKLETGLIDRDSEIKLSLLALLANENMLLIGPPGTAKSEIARRVSQVIDDGDYFEYLLTKFSTPEEIFGPLSIQELKKDNFSRKTEGYLPTVNIAFLDEIFKANSSILNSLLTIMNERVYHNGKEKENTNLYSIIGASNELPVGEEELSALYDRFLIRKFVDYLDNKKIDALMDISGELFHLEAKYKLDIAFLENVKINYSKISIPKAIKDKIKKIRLKFISKFDDDKTESLSDRRFLKILKLLKISAYTNGKKSVDIDDVVLMIHFLWSNPKNREDCKNLVIDELRAKESETEQFNKNIWL